MRSDREILEDHIAEKARRDILSFTRFIKPDYQINWHHEKLADALNDFVDGKIRFLMVFMPPRHGKSELVSRNLPAYLHGRYPDCEIMAASYLDSLAGDMAIAVQNIIDSAAFKKVFPETKIFPPGTSYTKGTRNSSEHHIVGRRGKYRGQGVGGSFTGKGCNFCFISGTKVLTSSGERPIQDLRENDIVWGFNHEKNSPELCRIEAISARRVSSVVRVKTALGREIVCTPEHPFFTEERSYCEARLLNRGDRVRIAVPDEDSYLQVKVRTVLERVRKAQIRIPEANKAREKVFLLFSVLRKKASQLQKQEKMRELFRTDRSEKQKILQLWVQAIKKARENNKKERIFESLLSYKGINNIKRRISVFSLWSAFSSCCASYRRKQKQQRVGKLNNSLSSMPSQSPLLKQDSISSVEPYCEGEVVTVYDIQVAGRHNFFAENILVHNCIIDDPIKGREIADSLAFRERLWKFWQDDLFSRLETNLQSGRKGQVLITQTRWHEDDLSGRLMEQMRNVKGAVQWKIIEYPAIRVDSDDPTDPREVGAPLWPAKYNLDQLDQIKATQGPRGWSSLYQQNPVPDGGGLFNSSMFEFIELPGAFDWSFITADTAYKEKQENDFNVFSAWGVIKDRLFLRGVWSKQMKAVDVEDAVLPFIQQYRNYGFRGAYIEPKGHGIYLNQSLARKGVMIPSEDVITEFYKDRRFDKVERANNVVPHLAARKIYINKDMGMKEDLVAQCLGFPKVKHDDFVDTVVDALKLVYAKKISMFDVA